MESYKHSCPFCGQHIEYTVGYCGQQMACPICGKTVTFPAIPPGGKGQKLHLKRAGPVQKTKWSFDLKVILACLREFEHWNIVLVCFVPFVIVGALLIGAGVLRKYAGNGPAAPVAPVVQADSGAWQKMTDLARADQLVQQKLGVVIQARAAAAAAERNRDSRQNYGHGTMLDQATINSIALQHKADEQAVANAQKVLEASRQSFEYAFQNYQKLGGTIDYRQQLPR
jgi:hypothetical protein